MSDSTMETISSFSKRTGLPDRLIRLMVRQGKLPYIKTGKSHVRIHVDSALEAIKQYSQNSADEIAATLPVPLYQSYRTSVKKSAVTVERKYKGRPPDSVRLANKSS